METQAPCLLSLPGDAILRVFAHFIGSEMLTRFSRPCYATNLAADHPRFGRLHRLAVVTPLWVSVDCSTEWVEQIFADVVQQKLRRCPRAEKVEILFRRAGRATPLLDETFLSAQLRAVTVEEAIFDWRDIRALLRAFPSLLELFLTRCS